MRLTKELISVLQMQMGGCGQGMDGVLVKSPFLDLFGRIKYYAYIAAEIQISNTSAT